MGALRERHWLFSGRNLIRNRVRTAGEGALITGKSEQPVVTGSGMLLRPLDAMEA
jgi:hypothetical protein